MNRHRLDCAVVRQHTSVDISIDSGAELICVQIIGDHSVVLMGLTETGAEMLIERISQGVSDLLRERCRLHDRGQEGPPHL